MRGRLSERQAVLGCELADAAAAGSAGRGVLAGELLTLASGAVLLMLSVAGACCMALSQFLPGGLV